MSFGYREAVTNGVGQRVLSNDACTVLHLERTEQAPVLPLLKKILIFPEISVVGVPFGSIAGITKSLKVAQIVYAPERLRVNLINLKAFQVSGHTTKFTAKLGTT